MSPITTTQLGTAYVSATAAAMIVAMGCKSYWGKKANPLLAVRFIYVLKKTKLMCFSNNFI